MSTTKFLRRTFTCITAYAACNTYYVTHIALLKFFKNFYTSQFLRHNFYTSQFSRGGVPRTSAPRLTLEGGPSRAFPLVYQKPQRRCVECGEPQRQRVDHRGPHAAAVVPTTSASGNVKPATRRCIISDAAQ